MPRSPRKKTAVLKKLFSNLTSDKKTKIGEDSMAARRARKLTEAKRIAAEFLERSDISYTCPGQRDQVYCGKDETGERVYRPKRYLLWKYSEVLAMLNDELEIKLGEKGRIGYGTFQYYMKMQKHIKPFSEKHFPDIPTTSKSELLKLIVCDPKSPGCIDGSCDECPRIAAISGLELGEDEDLLYHQWKRREGKNYPEKVMESGTTEETKELFLAQLLEYKRHHCNKLRQHEEMAYLREHLEAGEVIIQVDFSENYENQQQKEIHSAYFGHEAYAVYTACIWYILPECKKVTSASFAFVTDSTDHSKFGAFHYNKLLIRKAKYADQTLNIGVTFIPSTSIQQFEIPCAVLIPGTQAIRFVQRSLDSDEIWLNFYRNSQFRQAGEVPVGSAVYRWEAATYSMKSHRVHLQVTLLIPTSMTQSPGPKADSEKMCQPKCGDFVAVMLSGKRQKKLYVAQVTDTTPKSSDAEDAVQLKYMEAVKEGVYRWADDDYSRESVSSIVAILDPPHSVQGPATRETFKFNISALFSFHVFRNGHDRKLNKTRRRTNIIPKTIHTLQRKRKSLLPPTNRTTTTRRLVL
ncbi:hypothetical protein HOLleu_43072 [Holothuria leucospilota]|uniref:Uncharacterized protein n=1 Tax=Holothuria leucospilota TaxID=206669 RepID=A0A9Q0YHE6_HOLLE|nr:hypothetical protein HOLleu_43072 [Holothuria leucospilota]